MRASIVYPAALVALAVSSLASSSHNAIRRPAIPRRLDTEALSDPVAERGLLDALLGRYKGRATWYGVGVTMGACGKWTSTDSRAVALNIGLYGNPDAQSGWCGKKLRITANGRTSIAEVVDCCPTCPGNGDLDMSKTLFRDFADINDGIFQMSWSWVGADGGHDDDDDNDNKGNGGGKKPDSKHDDDDDEDKPKSKPKPKPSPKPTHTPKPKETETESETKTKTKSKTTKTKTAKPTATSTKQDDDDEDDSEETDSKSEQHSNLEGLNKVISGLQNLALSNHN